MGLLLRLVAKASEVEEANDYYGLKDGHDGELGLFKNLEQAKLLRCLDHLDPQITIPVSHSSERQAEQLLAIAITNSTSQFESLWLRPKSTAGCPLHFSSANFIGYFQHQCSSVNPFDFSFEFLIVHFQC